MGRGVCVWGGSWTTHELLCEVVRVHVCCAYVLVLCFEGAAGRRHLSYIEMQAAALSKYLLRSAPDQAGPGAEGTKAKAASS